MSARCELCARSFRTQADLDQHIRNSSMHKQPISRVKAKEPKSQSPRTYSLKREYVQTPNANAFSSDIPQDAKPTVKIDSRDEPWTVIAQADYCTAFHALTEQCHTPQELEESGHIMQPYNPSFYANSRKCGRCGSREKTSGDRECVFHPFKRNKYNLKRPYRCCDGENSRGCKTLPEHDHQLPLRALQHEQFRQTPPASMETKCLAVVLDCEMAGTSSGASEAVLVCVTDYLTGAVLVDQYVYPAEPITQMRTFIHGILRRDLEYENRRGWALQGWAGARAKLWKHIDSNTIIIGHALQNDLDTLRVIHPRIVDSTIVARKAVGTNTVRCGLQVLCSEMLDMEIRKNKGAIHDCMEDVLVTREIVLFCTSTSKQEAFQTWLEAKKSEELRLEKIREEKRLEEAKKVEERRREKEILLKKQEEQTESNEVKEGMVLSEIEIFLNPPNLG